MTGLLERAKVRVSILGAVVGAVALAASAPASAAPGSTTCDGTLDAGTYGQVVVPAGATCLSDGPVTIQGGLEVLQGATFVLGSEDSPAGTGTISGGVHATDAASVQIHFATINGGLEIRGGSGPFGGPFDVTFNAIEDNQINGGVTIEGYNGFWQGFIRNRVNGGVAFDDNVLADPDGNELVSNSIRGTLGCTANSPAPQVGDSEGSPNVVTGSATGQCAGL